MKPSIFIIDGMDNTGKSTFIKSFVESFNIREKPIIVFAYANIGSQLEWNEYNMTLVPTLADYVEYRCFTYVQFNNLNLINNILHQEGCRTENMNLYAYSAILDALVSLIIALHRSHPNLNFILDRGLLSAIIYNIIWDKVTKQHSKNIYRVVWNAFENRLSQWFNIEIIVLNNTMPIYCALINNIRSVSTGVYAEYDRNFKLQKIGRLVASRADQFITALLGPTSFKIRIFTAISMCDFNLWLKGIIDQYV